MAGVLAEESVPGWVEAGDGAGKESECEYAVPQLVGALGEGGDEDCRQALVAGDRGGAGSLHCGKAWNVWWEAGGGGCMTEFET